MVVRAAGADLGVYSARRRGPCGGRHDAADTGVGQQHCPDAAASINMNPEMLLQDGCRDRLLATSSVSSPAQALFARDTSSLAMPAAGWLLGSAAADADRPIILAITVINDPTRDGFHDPHVACGDDKSAYSTAFPCDLLPSFTPAYRDGGWRQDRGNSSRTAKSHVTSYKRVRYKY